MGGGRPWRLDFLGDWPTMVEDHMDSRGAKRFEPRRSSGVAVMSATRAVARQVWLFRRCRCNLADVQNSVRQTWQAEPTVAAEVGACSP